MIKTFIIYFFVVILFFNTVFVLSAKESESAMNILIVTGGHSFEKPNFFKMFDDMPNVHYDTVELPKDMNILSPGLEKKYDLILSYDMNNFPVTTRQCEKFAQLIESGMPLIVMHHSICGYDNWMPYWNMIGGKYLHKQTDIDGKTYPVSTYKHDIDINVQVADKTHPITRGIKDFTIRDEGYKNLYIRKGIHVLLTTNHPDATTEVAWTTHYGKAPIFVLTLGHDKYAYENPALQQILRQGIKWCVDNTGIK
jgi:type 1 glutamine amidotransferase